MAKRKRKTKPDQTLFRSMLTPKPSSKRLPPGMSWKYVAGRPVIIRTSDGMIYGGSCPKSWHGKRLAQRPWRMGKAGKGKRKKVR